MDSINFDPSKTNDDNSNIELLLYKTGKWFKSILDRIGAGLISLGKILADALMFLFNNILYVLQWVSDCSFLRIISQSHKTCGVRVMRRLSKQFRK